MGFAVEDDGRPNNVGITTETSKPHPVTQDHYPALAWPMLGSQEGAPQNRLPSEETEEVLRHRGPVQKFGSLRRRDVGTASPNRRHLSESAAPYSPIRKVRKRGELAPHS